MASLPLETDPSDVRVDAPSYATGTELLGPAAYSRADFVSEWSALAASASEPNPFFAPWFLLPSQRAYDTSGTVRLIAYRERGKLRGILPIKFQPRYYTYPLPNVAGWLHDNAFCGTPLVSRDCEARFWEAVLATLDSKPGGAIFFHLCGVPEQGEVFAALREVLHRQQRSGAIVHREQRALLKSDSSAEDYFAQSLSAKKRKELRRQHKRLSEKGALAFSRQHDTANIRQWADEYLALEERGWKGRNGSALAQDQASSRFFRETLAGAGAAGLLERLTLTLDHKPIAMLANFITLPGAFSFKTAYDEDYARFSPGVLLQRENLDLLDRSGIAWVDSCAAADHPMIERIWREKRTLVRISIAIGGTLRRALFQQVLRMEHCEVIT